MNRLVVLKEHSSISFLADAMLGNIARKLRIFGFDTIYLPHTTDDEILKTGIEQDRVILTADKELFRRIVKVGARGVLVGSAGASEFEDLVQIMTKSGITCVSTNGIGSRCSLCNGILEEMTSDQVKSDKHTNDPAISDVPDKVMLYHKQLFKCRACHKIYWEGRHLKGIRTLARNLDAELIGGITCNTTVTTIASC